jgi:GlpG protein
MPSNQKTEDKFSQAMGTIFNPIAGVANKFAEGTSNVVPIKPNAITYPKKKTTATKGNKAEGGDKSTKKTHEERIEQYAHRWAESMYEKWDHFCDRLEHSENENVKWFSKKFLRRLSIGAPVVVGFAFTCILLHVLNRTVLYGISNFLGVNSDFRPKSPMEYVRLVTHIFGHKDMEHLRSNMNYILLVGPSAEAAFGSKNIVLVMLVVAISSGLTHMLFGPNHTHQIGASGVVFALILLNSLVSAKSGKIPVPFVMTIFLWMGDEMWKFFFATDEISHHAHLVGGIVGTIAGYAIHQREESERIRKAAVTWKMSTKKD